MTREEFIVYIDSLEQKYPVNHWKIGDIHIWPLIKVRLSFTYHSFSEPGTKDSSSETPLFLKIKKAYKGLIQYTKILLKKKSQNASKLFCSASHFRYYDGNLYVNRYFNQLIDQSKKSKIDFWIGEYGNTTLEYRSKIDFPERTVYFEHLKYLALLLREITWKTKIKNLKWLEFEDFLEEINKKLESKVFLKETILKQFIYIQILKGLYKEFLKKFAVTEVYILCYYVSEMYAMNLAAAELKITSSDIQHGGQGSLHLAYSNFNKIPKTGYQLLPQKFWAWDTASASEISKWIKKQEYHEVQVKGNPWIEFCIQKYSSTIDTSKKIILYTMQPTGESLLEPYIIDAIKKTPSDYIWWLRLHPRQLMEIVNLKELLKKFNLINRVNIDDATRLPLPGILSVTYIHLSKFSGSLIEANMLKVKSIILDPIGVEMFPEIISGDYGSFILSKNSKDLLERIIE